MKKIKQFAWKVFIIIATGALGSAFWEFLIRDGILKFSKKTIEIVSLFSEKSINVIYSNPYQGDSLFVAIPSVILVYGSIFFFVYVYVVQRRQLKEIKDKYLSETNIEDEIGANVNEINEQDNEEKSEISSKTLTFANYIVKFYPWVMKIYILIYSLIIVVIFSTSSIKYGIKRTTEQNLKILKPYIQEGEFDLLYSQYLQVKSKSDFVSLQEKLDKIADQNRFKIKNPME